MSNTKKLLNFSEAATEKIIGRVAEEYGARVFAKYGLSDVLKIERSGISKDLYGYALMAHFDFVIADKNFEPLFAVEFDGPHHNSDQRAILNDIKKDELCKRFNFPLLRINADFLEKEVRQFNLLAWIVEIWFLEMAFDKAQESGQIPYDEVFCYFSILSTSLSGPIDMPYDLTLPIRLKIRDCQKKGLLKDHLNSVYCGEGKDRYWSSIALICVDENRVLVGKSRCRSYSFHPMPPSELCAELATLDLGQKIDSYLTGKYVPLSIEQAKKEVLRLKRNCIGSYFRVSGCGNILE